MTEIDQRSIEWKALGVLLLIVIFLLSKFGLVEKWTRSRIEKQIKTAVYAEMEKREGLATSTIPSAAEVFMKYTAESLARLYATKHLPHHCIIKTWETEESPDHWKVPVMILAKEGGWETINMTINKHSGVIECSGFSAVTIQSVVIP